MTKLDAIMLTSRKGICFKYMLYQRVRANIVRERRRNQVFRKNAVTIPVVKRQADKIIARGRETFPEAIARFFFSGWCWSLFLSIISFSM